MTEEGSSPSTSGIQGSSSHDQLQAYSCLQCKHRKVKCDRLVLCTNCRKSGVKCIYRAPPPRKRRKPIYREELFEHGSAASNANHSNAFSPSDYPTERERELAEKVRRYESILKDLGVLKRLTIHSEKGEIHSAFSRGTAGNIPGPPPRSDGKFVTKYGKSRYLENNLWTSVTDEFEDPDEILEGSSGDEIENGEDAESEATAETSQWRLQVVTQDPGSLIFPGNVGIDLKSLHPEPTQIFMLWQAYVDNVNPLIKILHVPTTQKAILDSITGLRHIPKAMEALLFGIYVIAVTSIDEAQCQSILQENKASALTKFRIGAQQALGAAGLLKTSDLMVLQAFVLFLLSARLHYDSRSFWSLTGISIRIGQRIGLHRDGEILKLPPFETEMRRRLWMNMIQLDSRAAELSGSGLSIVTQISDTKPPSNVNDCDLYPDMLEMPTEQSNATEMMFLLIRAQVGMFLQKEMPKNSFDGNWSRLSNPAISLEEKDRAINELEKTLEEKFTRYCDVQIPLHCISMIVSKAAMCKMRLFAHLPHNTQAPPSPSEEDILFTNSLKILQYDTQTRTTESIRTFLWHVDMHFQWHALIYILTYLHTHPNPSPRTDTAWTTVDEVLLNHREIMHGGRARSKLCSAVRSLVLKAWEAREVALRRSKPDGGFSKAPSCIQQLRSQRTDATEQASLIEPLQGVNFTAPEKEHVNYDMDQLQHSEAYAFEPSTVIADQSDYQTAPANISLATEMSGIYDGPINWEQWDSMCREFAMEDQMDDILTSFDTLPEHQVYATNMYTSDDLGTSDGR
ncbi:hypothetical protein M426DRAFT_16844 [Hypoxylon sp. CI-4A]|nr:hypothetical protein M426DRAFT_16844 [Hypoxylon sp. CI-4A]